jgi:adenosyl cobinamide kinase/adenosyl cobinamide phosphate guanylyltransferase
MMEQSAPLVFLTGPVRSGKSRRAVELARAWGDGVVFIATYRPAADDAEMAERVRRHRADRPACWRTMEAPEDVAAALAALDPAPSGIVLDSTVLWAAARLERDGGAVLAEWDDVLRALRRAGCPAVVVGDEIGWALVPADPGLRRFRDLVGWIGQRTAVAADEAWLMVAGCPVRLK